MMGMEFTTLIFIITISGLVFMLSQCFRKLYYIELSLLRMYTSLSIRVAYGTSERPIDSCCKNCIIYGTCFYEYYKINSLIDFKIISTSGEKITIKKDEELFDLCQRQHCLLKTDSFYKTYTEYKNKIQNQSKEYLDTLTLECKVDPLNKDWFVANYKEYPKLMCYSTGDKLAEHQLTSLFTCMLEGKQIPKPVFMNTQENNQ